MLDTEEEAIFMWNRRHEPPIKPIPISLEQLRGMDEPVWIEKLSPNVDLCDSGWAVVDGPISLTRRDNVEVSWRCDVWWFGSEIEDNPSVPDYGKTWLAYATEPEQEGEI